ncbi:hypothetical protein PHLGIDRAFT_68944 [Phlebiopsis gigantea 11061_1 CR5-6]|uniref:Uncharacterized protein n=1 Tax=Phlebiopsis gigantea (strain 11061_1 CR5-6) TaxID=745531 RepID=A0A0C3NTT8_PHLG1|nr:hypothetical protein PHLGIDRAFT_68944 [Phlebiopsis gigantea 11061_1 CR5-6]
MHLAALNIPDLLISLWRATLNCDANDSKDYWDWAIFRDAEIWKAHGKTVADATPYLPGSFDRPPRNIAEKLTSGYKAVEFLTYLYGLAPALLYGILPTQYWEHFCKLVKAIRLVYQRTVTTDHLADAHTLFLEFAEEFEQLYVQRKGTRVHFVRQSIHATTHIGPESCRMGPYGIVSQFPIERVIGDLGRDLRQHSNPFGNLAMIAQRHCQANAIYHLYPQFRKNAPSNLPNGALPLGDGYVLLRATERTATHTTSPEAAALREFVRSHGVAASEEWLTHPRVARWARLSLPNGQIARTKWREELGFGRLNTIRIARQIKYDGNGSSHFGEVQYFFKLQLHSGEPHKGYAMVSISSEK